MDLWKDGEYIESVLMYMKCVTTMLHCPEKEYNKTILDVFGHDFNWYVEISTLPRILYKLYLWAERNNTMDKLMLSLSKFSNNIKKYESFNNRINMLSIIKFMGLGIKKTNDQTIILILESIAENMIAEVNGNGISLIDKIFIAKCFPNAILHNDGNHYFVIDNLAINLFNTFPFNVSKAIELHKYSSNISWYFQQECNCAHRKYCICDDVKNIIGHTDMLDALKSINIRDAFRSTNICKFTKAIIKSSGDNLSINDIDLVLEYISRERYVCLCNHDIGCYNHFFVNSAMKIIFDNGELNESKLTILCKLFSSNLMLKSTKESFSHNYVIKMIDDNVTFGEIPTIRYAINVAEILHYLLHNRIYLISDNKMDKCVKYFGNQINHVDDIVSNLFTSDIMVKHVIFYYEISIKIHSKLCDICEGAYYIDWIKNNTIESLPMHCAMFLSNRHKTEITLEHSHATLVYALVLRRCFPLDLIDIIDKSSVNNDNMVKIADMMFENNNNNNNYETAMSIYDSVGENYNFSHKSLLNMLKYKIFISGTLTNELEKQLSLIKKLRFTTELDFFRNGNYDGWCDQRQIRYYFQIYECLAHACMGYDISKEPHKRIVASIVNRHNNKNQECPICYVNTLLIKTDCNHEFCMYCVLRISECALCRKTLNTHFRY